VLLQVTPHPDAIGLDDPQASCKRLLRELAHETLADLEDERLILPWGTEHHETRIRVRRIRTNVAEASIKSHEGAVFTLHQTGEIGVLRTAHTLVVDSGSVVGLPPSAGRRPQ
jgi:hypothetical protein